MLFWTSLNWRWWKFFTYVPLSQSCEVEKNFGCYQASADDIVYTFGCASETECEQLGKNVCCKKTNCNNPHKRRVISCWSAKAEGGNDGSAKFTIEPLKSVCKKGQEYGCFYQAKEVKNVTRYTFGCANKKKCTKPKVDCAVTTITVMILIYKERTKSI